MGWDRKRRPWVMSRSDQLRPGPPPALTSALWARDYNEIKAVGGKVSTQRTAEQTAVAKFCPTSTGRSPARWPPRRGVT